MVPSSYQQHHHRRVSRRVAIGSLGIAGFALFTWRRILSDPAIGDDQVSLTQVEPTSELSISELPMTLRGTPDSGSRNGFVFHRLGVFNVLPAGELHLRTEMDASGVGPGKVAGFSLRPDPPTNPNLELVWSRRSPPGGLRTGAYVGHHGLGQPAEYHYLGDDDPCVNVAVVLGHERVVFTHNGASIAFPVRGDFFEASGGRVQLRVYLQGGVDSQLIVSATTYSGATLLQL